MVGVPVGKIDAIEPRASDVKVTMTVKDGIKVPADARALIIAPNLVAARFVQLAPATPAGRCWPTARRSGWTGPPCRSNGTKSRSS